MKWIWLKKEQTNSFVEFERKFNYQGGQAELFISADYRYAAYVNGQIIPGNQYADLPNYKSVNGQNITAYLKEGENVLRILAWHMGEDGSICRAMKAGIAYQLFVDGKLAVESDKYTLSRPSVRYVKGDKITPQIAWGFHYNFKNKEKGWRKSKEVKMEVKETSRPIMQTKVGELCTPTVVAQGIFRYNKAFKKATSAAKMQNAWLSTLRFAEMTGLNRIKSATLNAPLTFAAKNGDGVFVIADMGRETCGHLGFTVTVEKPCKMLLGWGEHLADLRIRTERGGRNFGMEIALNAGENVFDDYLLRLGCRYVCLFVEAPTVTVSRLGIREVGYPFAFPKKDFGDRLLNAIYETGRRSLYLCAHDHYEDCPWREQALYGMDSRNQMLFGYGAFHEYAYPRASMCLFARCMQEDGFLTLCAPARSTITIPSFTAYWLIAIGENAQVDYDIDFVKEILPYAEKGLNALLARETADGISLLPETPYWNFHEWSDGLDGGTIFRDQPILPQGDANLTALTICAVNAIAFLERRAGDTKRSQELQDTARRLGACLEKYYDEERGVYASYVREGQKIGYHEYTQAVLLYSGAVPKDRIATLCNALKQPKAYELVPITLAGLPMKYDALVKYDGAIDFCVDDIVRIFGGMLFKGATSYWETENGEADFDDAGSLCHGWAAVACYVLDKYYQIKNRL